MGHTTNTVNKNKVSLNAVNRYITEEQFKEIASDENLNVFSLQSLENYRLDMYKAIKEAAPEEANAMVDKMKQEFRTIARRTVLLKNGTSADIFIQEKNSDTIEKAIKNKNDDGQFIDKKTDDLNESNDDSLDNEEDDELTDEEKAILSAISEEINQSGSTDEAEIAEEEAVTPAEMRVILKSLERKGLIVCEENDNGVCDVTEITKKGTQALGFDNDRDDEGENVDKREIEEEDDDNDIETLNKVDDEESAKKIEDEKNNNSDISEDDEEGDKDEEEKTGEDTNDGEDIGTKNGDVDKDNSEPSEEELRAHAAKTSDDVLQAFINKPDVDATHKKIAQEELAKRKSSNPAVDGEPGNEDVVDEETAKQEEEEFGKWVDAHFDEHDAEDLRGYTKKLIISSPGKLKELKEHYRKEYASQHGGNKLDKIDKNEFEEWLDQYLDHFPFGDLKDYTIKLLRKDPKAFNEMKGKYKELKDNDML